MALWTRERPGARWGFMSLDGAEAAEAATVLTPSRGGALAVTAWVRPRPARSPRCPSSRAAPLPRAGALRRHHSPSARGSSRERWVSGGSGYLKPESVGSLTTASQQTSNSLSRYARLHKLLAFYHLILKLKNKRNVELKHSPWDYVLESTYKAKCFISNLHLKISNCSQSKIPIKLILPPKNPQPALPPGSAQRGLSLRPRHPEGTAHGPCPRR